MKLDVILEEVAKRKETDDEKEWAEERALNKERLDDR